MGGVSALPSITRVDFFSFGPPRDVLTPGIPPGGFVDLDPIPLPLGYFDPDCDFRITVDFNGDVDEGTTGEANNSANGGCIG